MFQLMFLPKKSSFMILVNLPWKNIRKTRDISKKKPRYVIPLRVSQSLFLTFSNFDQNLVLDLFDYADCKNRIGLTLGRRILELRDWLT